MKTVKKLLVPIFAITLIFSFLATLPASPSQLNYEKKIQESVSQIYKVTDSLQNLHEDLEKVSTNAERDTDKGYMTQKEYDLHKESFLAFKSKNEIFFGGYTIEKTKDIQSDNFAIISFESIKQKGLIDKTYEDVFIRHRHSKEIEDASYETSLVLKFPSEVREAMQRLNSVIVKYNNYLENLEIEDVPIKG